MTFAFVCPQVSVLDPCFCVYLPVTYLISHRPVCFQALCITTLIERKENALFSFTLFFAPASSTILFLPCFGFVFHLFSVPSMSGVHASFTPAIGFGVGNWQPPGSQSVPNSPTRLPLLFASFQVLLASLFVQILFPFRFPPSTLEFCLYFSSAKLVFDFLHHNIDESEMHLFCLHLPLRLQIIWPGLASLSVSSFHP